MTTWRLRRWLLACGVIAAFASVPWVLLRGRTFDAEATLEYRPAGAGSSELSWRELLETERVVLRSRSVCERAARRLSVRSSNPSEGRPAFACEDIEVQRVPAARVLRIQASHPDAGLAAQIVEVVAQAYLERHAEQTLGSHPSLSAVVSELHAQSRELDLVEQEAESYARERGLLTYDAELERSELALLRQELMRGRIREIALNAELKQLELAVATKDYHAPRLAADPAFRELKVRISPLGAGGVLAPDAGVDRALQVAQVAALHELALAAIAAVRAERAVLRDQQRELAEYLSFQEERLAERDADLVELRKRRRKVAEHQALRDALLQGPAAAGSTPAFAVRLLDNGHVVGRGPSPAAWLRAGLLGLAALAGVAWAVLRVRA